ncbi:MAG: RNA methyltransferase [Candidatus Dormibacteraeota bacterium]|nr:RNA methyltransferase [Candidatus Dormibacteraeota bacterium]
MQITSAQNPRVRALAELRTRRGRDRAARMLVEGYDELRTALESGARPAVLYYSPSLVRDPAELSLLETVRELGAEVHELSPRVFEKVAYRQSPDGWLAELPAIATGLERLQLPAQPLLLVCAGVEKPGNLGAMLRTAEAAGVDAVIASPAGTDWGNPNVVRASRGSVFAVPVAEAEPAELVRWLQVREVSIAVTDPQSGAAYTSADLRSGLAVVVGAESEGLQSSWKDSADVTLRVPMFGRMNSLNVSTSAALVIYEALRQRGRLG